MFLKEQLAGRSGCAWPFLHKVVLPYLDAVAVISRTFLCVCFILDYITRVTRVNCQNDGDFWDPLKPVFSLGP